MSKQVGIPNDFESFDIEIRSAISENYSWNMNMINIPKIHEAGFAGKGIKYGIIDTGYHEGHSDLPILPDEQILKHGYDSATDDHGHGTHVWGIIQMQKNGHGYIGVAPDATAYIAKGLGNDGGGSFKDVAELLIQLADKGCVVANLSLSSQSKDKKLAKAIDYAWQKGCLCVVAGGNQGKNVLSFPANHEKVLSVGAVDSKKLVARFSNKGATLRIAGPGVQIASSWTNNDYMKANGTSMAAPHVTGIVVLFCEMYHKTYNKYPTPDQMVDAVLNEVIDLGKKGRDDKYGYGLAQAFFIDEKKNKMEGTDWVGELKAELLSKHFAEEGLPQVKIQELDNRAIAALSPTIWSLLLELLTYFVTAYWDQNERKFKIRFLMFKKHVGLLSRTIGFFVNLFKLFKNGKI